MKVPFVDLKMQYYSIKYDIDAKIFEIIDNTSFILGKAVEDFENSFAAYCNSKYAVCTNSGTSALHLALLAHGIGNGDEVITVPNTFMATASSVCHAGAKPVFVDVDKKTMNIDASKLKNALTSRTKAIIPVHLFGQPADMDPVLGFAKENNLVFIEDACQAHGAEYKSKKLPLVTGCFSFYPGKNLGAYGEGGAIVTNNSEVAEKIKLLRAHGESPKYNHKVIGYNYRMEGIQGAVLGVKLNYLDKWTNLRRQNAKSYNDLLSSSKAVIPNEAEYSKHVYHLYVIRSKSRDALREFLKKEGIDTGIHYPLPLHLQPALSDLNYKKGDFPVTEKVADEILSLPMFPELTQEQIRFVVDKIKEFEKKYKQVL